MKHSPLPMAVYAHMDDNAVYQKGFDIPGPRLREIALSHAKTLAEEPYREVSERAAKRIIDIVVHRWGEDALFNPPFFSYPFSVTEENYAQVVEFSQIQRGWGEFYMETLDGVVIQALTDTIGAIYTTAIKTGRKIHIPAYPTRPLAYYGGDQELRRYIERGTRN